MTIGEQLNQSADAMDALLTYANGVTEKDDSTIGDAIKTLCDGYGQGGIPSQIVKIACGLISSDDITPGYIDIPHYFGALPDLVYVSQHIPITDVAKGTCLSVACVRITDNGDTGNLKKNTYSFQFLYKHLTSANVLGGTYNNGSPVTNLNLYHAARGGADWATADKNGNVFNYIWLAAKFMEE